MTNERGTPPLPMTGSILLTYLEKTLEQYPSIAKRPVLLGDLPLNRKTSRGEGILLRHDSDPTRARVAMTAFELYRDLKMELVPGGMFAYLGGEVVKFNNNRTEVVNATVIDNHLVLQNFHFYLAYQERIRSEMVILTGGQLRDRLNTGAFIHGLGNTPIMFQDQVVTEATIRGKLLVLKAEDPSSDSIFLTPNTFGAFLGHFHHLIESRTIMLVAPEIDGTVIRDSKIENDRFFLLDEV